MIMQLPHLSKGLHDLGVTNFDRIHSAGVLTIDLAILQKFLVIIPPRGDAIQMMSSSKLYTRSLQVIEIIVSVFGKGVHGMAVQRMGRIRRRKQCLYIY